MLLPKLPLTILKTQMGIPLLIAQLMAILMLIGWSFEIMRDHLRDRIVHGKISFKIA